LIPVDDVYAILPPDSYSDWGQGYIYLGYVNNIYGYGMTDDAFLSKEERAAGESIWKITDIGDKLTESPKVYDNGVSTIYAAP
jgi:hypothetical protein